MVLKVKEIVQEEKGNSAMLNVLIGQMRTEN